LKFDARLIVGLSFMLATCPERIDAIDCAGCKAKLVIAGDNALSTSNLVRRPGVSGKHLASLGRIVHSETASQTAFPGAH
jgi:hypothetical protein